MLISLFITCYNDALFPETGKAVVSLLERLGHEVEFREAQTCCGQMHFNTGYWSDAASLMRRSVEVFGDAEVICVPSASCAGMIREQYPAMAAELGGGLPGRVAALLPRVFDLSELLVDKLGVIDVGAVFPHTVTLHTSCHSLRSLHLDDRPARLLRAVRGLRLVDLPQNRECCGFGGTFAVKNGDVSSAMVEDKVRCVLQTGAEVCVASDNSCLMQIGGALRRRGAAVRTMHLAEVLASFDPGGSAPAAPPTRSLAGGPESPLHSRGLARMRSLTSPQTPEPLL